MWSAFTKALEMAKGLRSSDVGAGQKATMVSGLLLARLKYFWGTPVYPGEPDSMSAAELQRQIDIIDLRLMLIPDDPALLYARESAWYLMWTRFNEQRPSLYSKASTAEEYITAVAIEQAPVLQTGPQRIDYAEIKRRLPLLDYVMRWDEVRRVGSKYQGHCPIHADSNPSMTIYPDQNKWWCFVCNEGGDVIDYERARLKNEKALPA